MQLYILIVLPGGRPHNIKHQVKFLVQEYYRVRQVVLEFMQARQDHSYYESDRVGHSIEIHCEW
jgi:hypothetical protein